MKHLHDLTPTDKIKLAAELDGCEPINRITGFKDLSCTEPNFAILYKPYATSYDAIIPLIQKLSKDLQSRVYDKLPVSADLAYTRGEVGSFIFNCTPSQLLNALLVATGKAEI